MTFIVFEGGDGVGKSTQIKLLSRFMMARGHKCLLTREPGGTPFAESIRHLFKKSSDDVSDHPLAMTELFLVAAARFQHLQKVLLPALNENTFVFCDRFMDSTYVYQSFVGKIPKVTVDAVCRFSLQNILPDITLVFQCSVKTSLERSQIREDRKKDRFDDQNYNFYSLISDSYSTLLEEKLSYPCGRVPLRFAIDAEGSEEDVFLRILKALESQLGIF